MRSVRPATKRVAVIATAVAITATLAGCGDKNNEPFRDAPRTGDSDRGAAEIIEMPDGFSNLATKCLSVDGRHNGLRIFVAYHGDEKYGAITAVADPTCRP